MCAELEIFGKVELEDVIVIIDSVEGGERVRKSPFQVCKVANKGC